jgi:hypothetical protein
MLDLQGEPLQRVDVAIKGMDILDREHTKPR